MRACIQPCMPKYFPSLLKGSRSYCINICLNVVVAVIRHTLRYFWNALFCVCRIMTIVENCAENANGQKYERKKHNKKK